MSYAVNSIVGSISGIVAYKDGSNSSFNAEINYDGVNTLDFVADTTESRNTMGRIANTTYGAGEGTTFRDGFNYIYRNTSQLLSNNFNWVAHANAAAENAGNAKTIVDAVYHLHVNIAFNDGTTQPFSTTSRKVGPYMAATNHTYTSNSHFAGATNKTTILAKLDDMLKQIINVTAPSA
jgi:hypothetical protein